MGGLKRIGKQKTESRTGDSHGNALDLLKQDHDSLKDWFDKFEKAPSDKSKKRIAVEVCTNLDVHMRIEEAIFYPMVRQAIEKDDLVDEAAEEHAVAKRLISDLRTMSPGDEHYEANFSVLAESVRHHIKEEEAEMFPKIRQTGLDLVELGKSMVQHKQLLDAAADPDSRWQPAENAQSTPEAEQRRRASNQLGKQW